MSSSGKTEVPGIYKVRDGILINTDNHSLTAYKNRKQRERNIDTMQDELKTLRDDISKIKEMLEKALK